MAFEVGVVARFEARHHLVGDFGPASQPHGHAYRVEVGAEGEMLTADGTLFDITRLQNALAVAIAGLEGADLNANPKLAEPNPSAEVVARYLFLDIAPALVGQGLELLKVRVWESDVAYASYAADPAIARK